MTPDRLAEIRAMKPCGCMVMNYPHAEGCPTGYALELVAEVEELREVVAQAHDGGHTRWKWMKAERDAARAEVRALRELLADILDENCPSHVGFQEGCPVCRGVALLDPAPPVAEERGQ